MNINSSADIRRRISDCFFLIAGLAVLVIYIRMAISANSDMAAGRFVLFMDERITFDGVKRILHPEGVVQFLDSVLNGGDHRYGRSLWNSMAIFSIIPERVFGDSGQIIAARMLQVFLIITSYCVFAFGVLRSWFLRFVLLVSILTVPFSDYFAAMPKPEPLQLLFLAIFSCFFVKRKSEFSWYWVFAGLAFGTKISTLPALLVFVLISLVVRIKHNSVDFCRRSLFNSIVAFFLGVAIAVPILFIPLLMGLGAYFVFDWVVKKIDLGNISRLCLAGVSGGVVFLVSRKFIKIWFSSTFLNITHGADQASINALSWLGYFFDKWLVAPYVVGLMLLILIFLYLVINSIQVLKFDSVCISERSMALAVALAGLALNIAIIIGTKRLWGFYLYPGMVLLIAGTTMLVDLNVSGTLKAERRPLVKLNRLVGYLIALFLVIVSGVFWAPQAIDGLTKLSLRTNASDYTSQYASYKSLVDFLDHCKGVEGRRLRVMFSPSLFPPESNEKFEIVEFWGPYTEWSKEPDLIILDTVNTPRGKLTPKDSPEYSDFLIERKGYAAHVVDKGVACKSSPCFIRELGLPNGGEVLVLSKAD